MTEKKKDGKVDFYEVWAKLEKMRKMSGHGRIELEVCPTNCPQFKERDKCTPENCVVIQEIRDSEEETLKAFELAAAGEEPKKRDTALRGNVYQQSRGFLRDELYAPRIRDAARIYALHTFSKKGKPLKKFLPNVRVSIYGKHGKSTTLIVSLEVYLEGGMMEHVRRHGKPLRVKDELEGQVIRRWICLRDCKKCVVTRSAVALACRNQNLRLRCPGCESMEKAYNIARKWFTKKYLPSIGYDDTELPYSTIRYRARRLAKVKGVAWR